MTRKLPDPLLPPEVDLRDFPYMPFYGERLFSSDTWILCNPEERVAALTLWWSSWHQEPPGSLPDRNLLMSRLAGYGVAVSAWGAVRGNALRGWIKCSDGRLYHPVICEIALDVWKTKRKKETGNAIARDRKRLKRNSPLPLSAGHPTDNPPLSTGQTPLVHRTDPTCPADNMPLSTGQTPLVPRMSDGQPPLVRRKTLLREENKKEGSKKDTITHSFREPLYKDSTSNSSNFKKPDSRKGETNHYLTEGAIESARAHAKGYDMRFLEAQFYKLNQDVELTNPTAAFIGFVKAHVKRNPL